ncbi:MAG: DEAD/DEAH box helicase [Candidatus Methylomirabilia bacterium]
MRILEYRDLDVSAVRPQYEKVRRLLEQEDFRAAQVKKLVSHDLYRAKLDDANRLLFRLAIWRGERCALILEVVLGHAYERSRFLRGAKIDESKIPDLPALGAEPDSSLPELPYVNPANPRLHLLDKVLSFDERQEEVFRSPLPLIVIGPAGSGKTALVLEKLRQSEGNILYVTLSAYLAEHARGLYWAHHYENERQEVSFLSFAEFLETLRVPEGRPISFTAFVRWFLRFPRAQRPADAHAVFEEFRGVVTGFPTDRAFLTAQEYNDLGVRQSLFPPEARPAVYALFEKYLAFLQEQRLYDPNILSHQYLSLARPAYDLVVIDEVQDITNVQLRLILATLTAAGQFILCGDSNQIVHPNFFSWSSLKSMLYREETERPEQVYRILHANFRNAASITDLANRLLRIKHRRFGSVDRESTYLMECLPGDPGEVVFLEDADAVKADLDRRTGRSTRFAVIVLREEDKAAARAFFRTPLLFSVHEAKGLEYENVILLDFISGQRAQFEEIARGIDADDLAGVLTYARGRDKADKSLEIFKFYVNSLYVAITRAVRRVYVIEGDARHPMVRLLGFEAPRAAAVPVASQQSSRDEWQAEARKLELQGKTEQAEEIRRQILQVMPVPWEVLDGERLLALLDRALDPREVSQKPRKALLEYALGVWEPGIVERLHRVGDTRTAVFYREDWQQIGPGHPRAVLRFDSERFAEQSGMALHRALKPYGGTNPKPILAECERYGIDHRCATNQTPLMLAATAGNRRLVRVLLEAGADTLAVDNYGRTAWLLALRRALDDPRYAAETLPELHELLVPAGISVEVEGRLVKIDNHTGEFLLVALFHLGVEALCREPAPGMNALRLAAMVERLPEAVVPAYRKKRSYLSPLLAKNEVGGSQPYNRRLFVRVLHGHYIFNPQAKIKRGEAWITFAQMLGLELLRRTVSEQRTALVTLLQGDAAWGLRPAKSAQRRRATRLRPAPQAASAADEHGSAPTDRAATVSPPDPPREEPPAQPPLPGMDGPRDS